MLRFAVFTTLIATSATTTGAAPLSLQQCIDQAKAHSPELSAYQHKLEADRQGIIKVRATTLPYLSSSLQFYELNGFPADEWAPVGLFQSNLGLLVPSSRGVIDPNAHWAAVGVQRIGVTYPLYFEGSILGLNDAPAVAIARTSLTEDEYTSMIEEQKVILDVTTSYLNAVSYRDQLDLNEDLIKLYQKDLDITKQQVAEGLILPQQIDIVSEELSAAQRAAESARLNANDYSLEVATLLGLPIDRGIELERTKPKLPELPDLGPLLAKVMPFHPALKVQDAKVTTAREQLRVDAATRLPTVTLNTNFAGAEDFDYFNGSSVHRRPTAFESYITVDIPIWDFGQRRAATRESTETVEYEKDMRAQLELTLRASIAEAYARIQSDARTVADNQAKAVAAEKQADLMRAERQQGKINELTLVNAELPEASTKLDVESAALAERLEYAELQDLLGGLWRWTP
jgi:outer membrane protein